jgi:hypothetical protein
MKYPQSEEYVFYKGQKFQVEFYYDKNGDMPVKEYFEGASYDVQKKLLALVIRIAEYGKLFDEEKYRIVDKNNKIFEFKPLNERFFNFFCEDRRIILTNAYQKQKQKVDPRELKKAVNLMKDYKQRVSEGKYYEKQK